jgi:phosphate transport system permease protein
LSRRLADDLLQLVCRGSAYLVFALLGGLCFFLLVESWEALARVGLERFFADVSWYPQASGEGTFGLAPMLVASLALGTSSLLVAIPTALGLVFYQRFYADPRIAFALTLFIELLGAVPSVVYGLVGLTVVVPLINRLAPPGSSLLAGVIVLVPMIVPTIALVIDGSLERESRALYLNAAALALSRATLAFRVLLPSLRPAIATGCVLALGRAFGETMAVLMVTGNVIQLPGSLASPVRALTSNIALEMPYALGVHRSALFLCGLILVLFTLPLFFVAKWSRRGSGV